MKKPVLLLLFTLSSTTLWSMHQPQKNQKKMKCCICKEMTPAIYAVSSSVRVSKDSDSCDFDLNLAHYCETHKDHEHPRIIEMRQVAPGQKYTETDRVVKLIPEADRLVIQPVPNTVHHTIFNRYALLAIGMALVGTFLYKRSQKKESDTPSDDEDQIDLGEQGSSTNPAQ